MPVTLITGRANTGKTGRALSIYRDDLLAGGSPVVILPSQPDVQRMVKELASERALGVEAMGFDAFVASRWDAVGDGRGIITPVQRRVLLGEVLREIGSSGPGFARLTARAVQHLASEGDGWRALSPVSGDAAGLGLATAAYARELELRGLVEPGEAADIVARALSGEDTIIFHRFSDLTPAEEQFVGQASASGAHAIVTLTWEPGFAATETLDPLVARLATGAMVEHLPATDEHTLDPELRRIEQELFTLPGPQHGSGSVTFLMGEGPEAEADIIAGQVVELISGGISPERIAVVFRRPQSRVGTLRRAFAEAGVRIDLDVTLRFADIPFGRAFSHAVSLLARGDRTDALFLIRSGYLCEETPEIHSMVRRWLSKGTFESSTLLAGLRQVGGWQHDALRELRDRTHTANEYARLWDSLATRMFAQRHAGAGDEGQLALDARARSALTRLLDDMRSLDGAQLDPQTLGDQLKEFTIGARRVERPGHVQVASAERVRGRRFDALVLGGLNAGEFPMVYEDPLQSEVLAALWEAAGVRPPPRREASAERALLYAVLTRPKLKLILSRLITGPEGDDVGASVFWEEVRDFYRSPQETDPRQLEEDRVLRLQESGLSAHAASSLRAGLRAEVCASLEAQDEPTSTRVAAALGRARRLDSRAHEERLAGLGSADTFSPSALEKYSRCPYNWFVTQAVGDRGIEFQVDALLKGSISHAALESFYRERTGTRPADDASEEELLQHARRGVERALEAEDLPAEQAEILIPELASGVLRSLRADAGFLRGYAVAETEWSFGWEDQPTVALGPYSLRGRVDRIDTRGKSAVVIDYKLGSVERFAASKLRESNAIQAPLYAYAVEKALGVHVHGAFYRGLTDGRTRGVGDGDALPGSGLAGSDLLAPDEYRELIDWAVAEGVRAAEGIRAGEIGRSGGDYCKYCPVSGWCEARDR